MRKNILVQLTWMFCVLFVSNEPCIVDLFHYTIIIINNMNNLNETNNAIKYQLKYLILILNIFIIKYIYNDDENYIKLYKLYNL